MIVCETGSYIECRVVKREDICKIEEMTERPIWGGVTRCIQLDNDVIQPLILSFSRHMFNRQLCIFSYFPPHFSHLHDSRLDPNCTRVDNDTLLSRGYVSHGIYVSGITVHAESSRSTISEKRQRGEPSDPQAAECRDSL